MPPGEKKSCSEGSARVWVAVEGIGGSLHHTRTAVLGSQICKLYQSPCKDVEEIEWCAKSASRFPTIESCMDEIRDKPVAVDTIAAISTPPGRGGIGIVRL